MHEHAIPFVSGDAGSVRSRVAILACAGDLRDDPFHDLAMDISQPEVAATVSVCEPLVVNAQQV